MELKTTAELLRGMTSDDLALGFSLADAWAMANIADGSDRVVLFAAPEVPWLDSARMLDPRLHAPEVVAMNANCLAWAERRELIRRHGRYRRLVLALPEGQAAPAGVPVHEHRSDVADSEGGEP